MRTEMQEVSVVEIPKQRIQESFFVLVPITKFSSIKCPCVEIGIGQDTVTVELDLGFKGELALTSDIVKRIDSKTFLGSSPMYGFLGTEYPTNFYHIPEMNVGQMFFNYPVLQEEEEEFSLNTIFVKEGHNRSLQESGRLGWELFYHNNLLLDIANSQIAFCDSLDTLKKEGYPTESFTKAPLFLERGLVEFDITTPNGPLRCMLDTGATWNFLNVGPEEERPIEEMMWDPDNLEEFTFLKIGEEDFGPMTFTRIPIRFPIHVEAILGMEFIRDHLIFIDFEGRNIYFQK